MTKNAIVVEELARVAVVAVGSAMGERARSVASLGSQTYDLLDSSSNSAVLSQIGTQFVGASEQPAILLVSSTSDASIVTDFVRAAREVDFELRPRIWPAFVAGSAKDLEAFDLAVDELGPGACDVVLFAAGQANPRIQADALRAWLQVKLPAPASVLADLPDKAGRSCRYVAIGCQTVTSSSMTSLPELLSDEVDIAAVVQLAQPMLYRCMDEAPSVRIANEAASALCAAAEHFDVTAMIAAESELSKALVTLDRTLPGYLESKIPALIGQALDAAPTSQESTAAQTSVAPSGTAGSRVELVSALAQLAGKGAMSRMFAKSRMTALADQVATEAREDVSRACQSIIGKLQDSVAAAVKAESQTRRSRRQAEREELLRNQQTTQEAQWERLVREARDGTRVWPTVRPSNVQRSWGGGIPAPRQYVVSTADSAVSLADDDGSLAVIDLRDDASRSSNAQRSAVILVAQYGLPLSALA